MQRGRLIAVRDHNPSNIIHYGICGEGYGHFSRVEFIAPVLLEAGYRIRFFSNGDHVLRGLRRRYPDCECVKIRGLRFVYRKNSIDLPATAFNWLKIFGWWIPESLASIRRIREDRPCAIITDYEPTLAQSALYTRTPLITIDHQQIISECAVAPLPVRSFPLPIARLFNTLMNASPKLRIAVSFYHPPLRNRLLFKSRKCQLTGPLLRTEVLRQPRRDGEHILIYQTSQSLEWLDRVLDQLPGEKRVYGSKIQERPGVIPRPFDNDAFIADLASCRFAVVNGGHSTICEALYFGKPIISIPVRRQLEQEINALYVEKLGFGKAYWLQPDEVPDFGEFLKHEAEFKKNIGERVIPPGHEQVRSLVLNFLSHNSQNNHANTRHTSTPPIILSKPTIREQLINWPREQTALVVDLDGTLHEGRWPACKGLTNIDLAFLIGWQLRPLGLPLPPPVFSLRVLIYAWQERLWRSRYGKSETYFVHAIQNFRQSIIDPIPPFMVRSAAEQLTRYAYPDLSDSIRVLERYFGKLLIASKGFEPALRVYANYLQNGSGNSVSIMGNPIQSQNGIRFASGQDKADGLMTWLKQNQIRTCMVVGDTEQDLAMAQSARELLGERNCLMVAMHPKSENFARQADLCCHSWSALAGLFESIHEGGRC